MSIKNKNTIQSATKVASTCDGHAGVFSETLTTGSTSSESTSCSFSTTSKSEYESMSDGKSKGINESHSTTIEV